MNTVFRHFAILFFTVLLFKNSSGQEIKTINFFNQINTYDLAKVLTTDSILLESSEGKIKRPEILGYIGNDYQRFYIHFSSIIKKPSKALRIFCGW